MQILGCRHTATFLGMLAALLALCTGARAAVTFSADSPFNHRIARGQAADSASSSAVAALVATGQGININTGAWTPAVYSTTRHSPLQTVNVLDGYRLTIPIPPGARPPTDTDGGMEIVDRASGCAYDFFRAARAPDGTWSARGAAVFNLHRTGVHLGWSTRASGFALSAGLITPHDVRAGIIRHALVLGVPRTSAAIRLPATTSDGRDAGGVPMGSHLQLDPKFDVSMLPRDQRPIARALQRYGAFVGETSGAIAVYAQHAMSTGRFQYPASWSHGLAYGVEIVKHLRLLPAPTRVRLDRTPTQACPVRPQR